ncbi:MAG: D-2-hydroxyacid dehydrogenase [Deltaproteobacteria bacterium]|nr:D-2-hydroxyacid dehydrogenase [Deltaproteobacteria bacterium]
MKKKAIKIVFLDAHTLDLGDLDLKPLKSLGDYQAFQCHAKDKLPKEALEAEILITNKVLFTEKDFRKLSSLKLLCISATGVNNVDLKAAENHDVGVCNATGYSTFGVVEHTLMMMLAFSHRFKEHNEAALGGTWSNSSSFTLLDFPFTELRGKRLGILGYGEIGRALSRVARALGMEVLIGKIPDRTYGEKPQRVSFHHLLSNSDFVTLHCPLSEYTKGLIDAKALKLMKEDAYLLNMARGPIVVEKDIVDALSKNKLAGYGADVSEVEPPPKNHPFFKKNLQNKIILTPHVAWASRESRQRLVEELAKNIEAFLKGKKRNRVV